MNTVKMGKDVATRWHSIALCISCAAKPIGAEGSTILTILGLFVIVSPTGLPYKHRPGAYANTKIKHRSSVVRMVTLCRVT